jgi:predicted dienelactone hydrolase
LNSSQPNGGENKLDPDNQLKELKMTYTFHQLVRNTAIGSALVLSTTLASPVTAFADTGYMSKTITAPHRKVHIKLDIYFPAKTGGETQRHSSNAVFTGIDIIKEAKPLPGNHPVVIFSHGSGGNGINTGWFAKSLADKGMIVIAPNHPRSTSRDSDPEQSLKTWERPEDMSAIVDQLSTLLPEGLHADEDRIAAAGFSLGGYSVLSLAGAQISKAAFIDYCTNYKAKDLQECEWFTYTGFDLNAIDQKGFEKNNIDTRFKAIVSIDPGFAAAFQTSSLEAINTPVKIINLGDQGTVPEGVDSAELTKAIPAGEYVQIAKAWHFDFLGECTIYGPALLAVTFDDPICSEPNGGKRSKIHAEIAEETIAFLSKQFALMN